MAIQDVEVLAQPFPAKADDRAHRWRISRTVFVDLVRVWDACLIIAGAGVVGLWQPVGVADLSEPRSVAVISVAVALGLFAFSSTRSYDFWDSGRLPGRVARAVAAWFAALAFLSLVIPATHGAPAWFAAWGGVTALGLMVARFGAAYLVRAWVYQGRFAKRVAIYGSGEKADLVFEWMARQQPGEFALVGVFDDPSVSHARIHHSKPCGTFADLLAAVRDGEIDQVVVTLSPAAEDQLRTVVSALRRLPVDVYWPLDVICGGVEFKGEAAVDGSFLRLARKPLSDRRALYKWMEDKILGSLFLAVASPLMVLIALAIKMESSGPVLFRQPRIGFNNGQILVYKFRTMYHEQGDITGAEQTVVGDPRVTKVGRVLRRLNLDELPQLINVLQGRLSIVGPRPHPLQMKAEDRLYHEAVAEYVARHRVRPGITGWAQVNGLRGPTDTMDKATRRVEYDLDYIERWSIRLDLKIILLTFLRGFLHPNAV